MQELTADNYYENHEYISNSELRRWRECPAKALAMHRGEYSEPATEAMILGNLVDHAITQPHKFDEYAADNGCFKKNGEMYAWAMQYSVLVDRLRRDEIAWNLLTTGECQVPLTGEIAGVPFKGLVDSLQLEKGIIADLKTARSLGDEWSAKENKRQAWYVKYYTQMAIYRHLAKQKYGKDFTPVLVAVSKQDPPALDGIAFLPDIKDIADRMDFEIACITEDLPTIMAQREGRLPAPMCRDFDNCRFCRMHSKFEFRAAKVR